MSRGNGIAVSPDQALLYITRDNGRLDILVASDGSHRWSYTPERVGPNFFPVACSSSVYFGDLAGIGTFAVYNIIDQPPPGFPADASR